jgi:sulfate adenylyltransferase
MHNLSISSTAEPASPTRNAGLIAPFGGTLIDLYEGAESVDDLRFHATTLPRVRLTRRNSFDLELMANGAFSPLDRYMGREDYSSVVEDMRLRSGVLFPIPITLSVEHTRNFKLDSEVGLVDDRNEVVAVMRVDEIYERDFEREPRLVYGTNDMRHPMVSELRKGGSLNISGPLRMIKRPWRQNFFGLCLSPAQVRAQLLAIGATTVVAFHTRNPLHRAHQELVKRALQQIDGTLLLHPVVGLTKPGDIDSYARVLTYRLAAENLRASNSCLLSLLPLAMRMAGPREVVWHAIVRRNFGADHFIVGRDHASPGTDAQGRPFYGPYEAQHLLERHSEEIGMRPVLFSEFVYVPTENRYELASRVGLSPTKKVSGSKLHRHLQNCEDLPDWIIQPEFKTILTRAYPPRHQQGFCVWFTGLSGSGKSTIAELVTERLLEQGRQVTLLDGDTVRTHLSNELSFSKEDRDANLHRIAFVAAEIVRHGGAVVCATVSPYRDTRNECRQRIGQRNFIEVYVNTPLEECETRDAKGLYRLARQGKIKNFTGVDDRYERPFAPEIEMDTVTASSETNAALILEYIVEQGFLLR